MKKKNSKKNAKKQAEDLQATKKEVKELKELTEKLITIVEKQNANSFKMKIQLSIEELLLFLSKIYYFFEYLYAWFTK